MTVKYLISGLVQGVGYRFFTYKNADNLGLDGYAKNLYDGRVEVIASGEEDKLKQFESFLRQGPSRSNVTNIEIDYPGTEYNCNGFDIK